MNSLALIVMFYNLAKQYAKSYADKLLGRVATGFNWLGAVKYHSDLPASANEGDAYTVMYTVVQAAQPLMVQNTHGGSLMAQLSGFLYEPKAIQAVRAQRATLARRAKTEIQANREQTATALPLPSQNPVR